jgi:hypothetical protein
MQEALAMLQILDGCAPIPTPLPLMLILAASSVEETLKAAQAPGLLQLFILHHLLLLCPPLLLMTALLRIRICFCPTITTQTTTL